MLDKNDRKYIIRRIITYIAIAMIMFLISSCQAKAMTTASDWNNYYTSWYVLNQNDATIPVTKSNLFRDTKGELIMTIYSAPIDSNSETLKEVTIQKTNDSGGVTSFICRMGTLSIYSDNQTHRDVYTLSCPVDFTNGRFSGVHVRRTGGGTLWLWLSQNVTVADTNENGGAIVSNQLSDILSRINTGFGDMYSMNSYISGQLTNIYNQMTTQNQNITQSINSNTQAINDVNNSLNDSTPPSSSEITGNTSDWNSYNASNGVINDLVLMPITLLNSFVNGMNNSCSSYDLGDLWGEHIILPCIDLSQMLGSVWTIIDVILSGVFIFVFGKQCVKIFNDFTNLKSGQIDTLYGGGN